MNQCKKDGEWIMGVFSKWFGQRKTEPEVFPMVPEGMKGVFMKGIGMH
jgi:hypothetical protein